jgi:IS1 family transposase
VPADKRGEFGFGDVWTFVAIDADTRLVPAWTIGARGPEAARVFLADMKERMAHRVQLTTDGHRMYLTAVPDTFGDDIDYAQLVKIYATPHDEYGRAPGSSEVIGTIDKIVSGDPDVSKINTSYIERQNLTMRTRDAAVHADDQRPLKEGRKPRSGDRAAFHVHQLRSAPQEPR